MKVSTLTDTQFKTMVKVSRQTHDPDFVQFVADLIEHRRLYVTDLTMSQKVWLYSHFPHQLHIQRNGSGEVVYFDKEIKRLAESPETSERPAKPESQT